MDDAVDGSADDRGAQCRLGGGDDEAARECAHRRIVAAGLVGLEHRELRVVGGVDAFVAEVAADLEDPFEPADERAV